MSHFYLVLPPTFESCLPRGESWVNLFPYKYGVCSLWVKVLLEQLYQGPCHPRPGFLEDLGQPDQAFEGQGVEE